MIFGTLVGTKVICDSRSLNTVTDSWSVALMLAGLTYVEARRIIAKKLRRATAKLEAHWQSPIWLYEKTYLVEL